LIPDIKTHVSCPKFSCDIVFSIGVNPLQAEKITMKKTTRLAKSGDAEAQFKLGLMYANPHPVFY
jgi:hypothetical protein